MRSILKVTLIACLFYGCCDTCCESCEKEHVECKDLVLDDGDYVEATLISHTNSDREIGFFSINEDDDMSLIAFTKKKIKDQANKVELKLHNKYYISIKICNDIYWVKEITTEKPSQVASPPESNIKYHAFFDHNHNTKHKFGHVPKNDSNSRKEAGTQNHPETMYELDIYKKTNSSGF